MNRPGATPGESLAVTRLHLIGSQFHKGQGIFAIPNRERKANEIVIFSRKPRGKKATVTFQIPTVTF